MRRLNRTHLFLLVLFCAAAPCLMAQTAPDAAYNAKRQEAASLFNQGKRLEALPLLEELVKANPTDDQMLVALAACLVDHAATLTDEKAAGQERFRARDLLEQAWRLGNTSPLGMNLEQLLKQLPASGAIKFSDNPQVDQVLRVGEAAFSRRDFDEALKNYFKALELDPKNYIPALFIGNTYDKENEFPKAAEWYERAIQLDPNIETAYRYYADMLARQGDIAKARTMLIHAAVAEPYNRIVWRELRAWATLGNTQINEVWAPVPVPPKKDSPEASQIPPEISAAWQAYYAVKNNWEKGGEFQKHFPQEKEYRHSMLEEFEALNLEAKMMGKLAEDKKTAEFLKIDPNSGLLLRLYHAALIEPYVLFSLGDDGIARDYAAYRAKNRDKLEEYMDKFVVPSISNQHSAVSAQPR